MILRYSYTSMFFFFEAPREHKYARTGTGTSCTSNTRQKAKNLLLFVSTLFSTPDMFNCLCFLTCTSTYIYKYMKLYHRHLASPFRFSFPLFLFFSPDPNAHLARHTPASTSPASNQTMAARPSSLVADTAPALASMIHYFVVWEALFYFLLRIISFFRAVLVGREFEFCFHVFVGVIGSSKAKVKVSTQY